MMLRSNSRNVVLFLLCATFVFGTHSMNYHDLEALGASCPLQDSCSVYKKDGDYLKRSCECDNLCSSYKDCCIDAKPRKSSSQTRVRNNVKCLPYGENPLAGVYVISKCSNNWNGPREVREKCLGPVDFKDPLTAAPVTYVAPNVYHSVTYRNLFCAECNNANMSSITTFQLLLTCNGVLQLTDEEILADLSYNRRLRSWGVNRLNSFGNATDFFGCEIVFDIPHYIHDSVRFCRPNLTSTCAKGWSRNLVKIACNEYMAVVYVGEIAYRNPHCAICNLKTVDLISCVSSLSSRKRPMSFALLLDVNQSDGDQVGMKRVATPECPSGHKYDPFFQKCRMLVCALPGYTVQNGKCVKG